MEALNAFISSLFLGFTSYYSQIIRYGAIQYEVRFLGGEAPPLWCPQLMQVHVFPFHVNSLSPWHPPHLSCLKTLFHPQFGQCESYSRMQRSSVRLVFHVEVVAVSTVDIEIYIILAVYLRNACMVCYQLLMQCIECTK